MDCWSYFKRWRARNKKSGPIQAAQGGDTVKPSVHDVIVAKVFK
jgi:hypothetical protein